MANEKNVNELVQNARHKSVNEKRLTELKGGLTARYLYDKPLIDYLDDDEQPHFILAARQKAPKFSGPDSPSWGGTNLRGMAMHLITDQRWLIVAGDKPSDQTFEIPIVEIFVTDYSTGTSGHEINIETPDYSIDIPIGNMYDSDEIESAVKFLKKFGRSGSVNKGPSDGADDTESARPEKLVNNARHESMDKKHLTKLKSGLLGRYLYDKPLIEYLHEGEQPHYLLEANLPINFSGADAPEKNDENLSGKAINLLTDKRWIIIEAKKSGDEMWSINYDDLVSVEVEADAPGLDTIFMETSDYSVEILHLMNQPTEEAINYVRSAHLGEESEPDFEPIEIINRTRGSDNSLYAKLIVPTQSAGATFSSQGWNVGGDIVRRTSSKGKIEEDNWENYVKKFIIHEDHVEIGVTHGDLSVTSDNRIHENIRINLSDITDVRVQSIKASTGFVFETSGDVYQFKLTRKGKLNTASRSDAKDAVRSLKKAIREAPEPEAKDTGNNDTQATEEDSPTEKLSQIKELHDQGVLTDEEFEDKKQELLDQI